MMLLSVCLTAILLTIPGEARNTQIYVDGCLPGTEEAKSLHCLSQENHQLREEAQSLRKQLGALSCRCDDLGPSGGFCLDPKNPTKGGNAELDGGLDVCSAKETSLYACAIEYTSGASCALTFSTGEFPASNIPRCNTVSECHVGHYGKALELSGADCQWTGYDGSEQIEEATDNYVHYMDLSKPHWLGKQYDWVMSLEVGEHLPSEMTATFVGNLKRHAHCGIVLSWARPGQGGHYHVNELSNADVISMIEEGRELHFDRIKTAQLRKHASFQWLKPNLMVFETKKCSLIKDAARRN